MHILLPFMTDCRGKFSFPYYCHEMEMSQWDGNVRKTVSLQLLLLLSLWSWC